MIFMLTGAYSLYAQPSDTSKLKPSYYLVNDYVDDNERCLKCHGELKYTINDPQLGRTMTEHMCPDRIIDREAFYSGVHKSFSCNDCHSYGFEKFPHSVESRVEEMLLCMDCHGYDESLPNIISKTLRWNLPGAFITWKSSPAGNATIHIPTRLS